ncbi:MAG: hypothetical protein ACOX6T_00745 [Myxococcales bacterium]
MRIRLLSLLAIGALLGMSACASDKGATKTEQPVAQAPDQEPSELEQRIAEQASGSQPGKVASIDADDNRLVLDPYSPAAGDAELVLEDRTPVFRGGEQVSMNPEEALEEGSDVIVYFQTRAGEPPLVLGITILEPEQAREIQEQMGVGGAGEQQAQERPEEFARADAMQVGKVSRVTEDVLVLDPYEEEAEEAELSISDDVKVVRNGVEVGMEALSEGADVRVFYELNGDDRPEIIGVEILSSEEAEELK